VDAISELTSKTPNPSTEVTRKGVGQVIKKVTISTAHMIDFCSKWSYPVGPNKKMHFLRNIENCIKNSLQYNGKAKYLSEDPKQHSWLVGDS